MNINYIIILFKQICIGCVFVCLFVIADTTINPNCDTCFKMFIIKIIIINVNTPFCSVFNSI